MKLVSHLLIFGPLAASLFTLVPIAYPFQEANLSLGAYYLVHHILALLLLIGVRRNYSRTEFRIGLVLLLGMSFGYLRVVTPYYLPVNRSSIESPVGHLSVFFVNTYLANQNHQALKSQIVSSNPDIIGLVEVDQYWLNRLALTELYPHRVEMPRDDNYGIALYSKFELTEIVTSVGEELPPVIMASVEIGGAPIRIVCLHALNPLFGDDRALVDRNLVLRRVVSRLRDVKGNAVVMGDFNATPFSKFYNIYVGESEFRDAMWGYGLWRSWDAFSQTLRLKLDHVLYRGDMAATDFEMMPFFGSDHLPMRAVFQLGAGFDTGDDVLNNSAHD